MALTTLTGAPTFDSVRVPNNGTKVVAASGSDPPPNDEGPVRPAFQALTNRDEYITTYGGRWPPPVMMWSVDSSIVYARGVNGLDGQYAPALSGTFGGGTPGTWYYVYTHFAAGLVMEFSDVAPEESLLFKSTDPTRRYLGAFRASSGGGVTPFNNVRGDYAYVSYASVTSGVLSNASWLTLPLTAAAPPHCRRILTKIRIITSAAGDVTCSIRPAGVTGVGAVPVIGYGTAANPRTIYDAVDLITDSAQQIELQLGSAVANVTAEILFTGWKE